MYRLHYMATHIFSVCVYILLYTEPSSVCTQVHHNSLSANDICVHYFIPRKDTAMNWVIASLFLSKEELMWLAPSSDTFNSPSHWGPGPSQPRPWYNYVSKHFTTHGRIWAQNFVHCTQELQWLHSPRPHRVNNILSQLQ